MSGRGLSIRRSRDADISREPGLLMFDDMAMKGPIARVVCYEDDIYDFIF